MRAWVKQSEKRPIQTATVLWGGVTSICASLYGIVRGTNSLRAFWQRLARQAQHWLAAKKCLLATIGKSSGITLNNSTVLHATQAMYRCLVTKAASKEGEIRRECGGRDTVFKFIRLADYVQDHHNFRSVAGSGEENEGLRTMNAARQLLSMGAAG